MSGGRVVVYMYVKWKREFRVIRKKYKEDDGPMPCLYGCPNSRDIEEKKEVETKVEIVYF